MVKRRTVKKKEYNRRKFGGKWYYPHPAGVQTSKNDAKIHAKAHRNFGNPSRIVKVKGGYLVYRRFKGKEGLKMMKTSKKFFPVRR